MMLWVKSTCLAISLLGLGALALALVECGTNSDDQGGGGQGGSNAQTGTGGAMGGDGGSGTGGSVQTGYECSAGGGASGTAGETTVPRTCYPYVSGSFYCSPRLCGCDYNPVTGCLCADSMVSPCQPLDPTCTEATAHGTANLGMSTVDPTKNVGCYCDVIGYWWCNQ